VLISPLDAALFDLVEQLIGLPARALNALLQRKTP
jgi:hypothetical protein